MANNWIKCSIVVLAICTGACQSRPSQSDGSVFVVYPEPIAKFYVDHTEGLKFMPRTTKRLPTTRKLSLNALFRDEKVDKLSEKFVKSEPTAFETVEEARRPGEFDAVAMSNSFNTTEVPKPEQRQPIDYDSKISAVLLGILNETVADSPDKKEDYTTFIDQTIGNVPQKMETAANINDMASIMDQMNDEMLVTTMASNYEGSTTLANEMMDPTDVDVTTVTEGIDTEMVTDSRPM